MNIIEFDREMLMSIVALIMLTLFFLDVIMLFMAIKIRRGDERNSTILPLIKISAIGIGIISILLSFLYWCILR